MTNLIEQAKPYALAVASMVVTGAAYFIGVIPADGGFGDVTTVQWLGLVVAEGASFGITARATFRNPPTTDPAPGQD